MSKVIINSIVAGVPTVNNRIYTEEALKKAVEKFNEQISEGKCFVVKNKAVTIDIKDITMEVTECTYQKDRIEVVVKPINDAGKILEQLVDKGDFKIVPNVVGEVNNDSTVRVDGVISFVSFPKDAKND